ncbi:hypothetical protein BJY01DRAFT_264507 [Aspergillus pseudoustus]|uniref:Zn(2)-C6 fungal-type domain-containing protein n=1 Tax=Aspergillus pseudoustus TaxID=1810923 RepID=A0ABR4JRH2_9EURO
MIGPSFSRRKGVRKGTRSCWECRRRKVKCLPSPDIAICAGCRERGTECLSQEYVDDPSPPRSADDSALAQRVARVESLLETLLDRISPRGQAGELTPESILATTTVPRPPPELPSNGYRLRTEGTGLTKKLESLRQRLAAMLPCQADVDRLFTSSHGFWLLQQHMMPHLPDLAENDSQGLFDVAAVSREHPIAIARLLLCIAICIQQLPPEADMRQLQTTVPIREIMSGIIEFIAQHVISDDELAGSMEGIECLAIYGMYAVNAGNLRRSWLLFRKAITVGQLLGLHRAADSLLQDTAEARRHHLWYQISRGERYLSTILGLPSSTGSAVFPFDDNAFWLSVEDQYHKKLYLISGLILDRNQGDGTHSFSTTLRISEQLDLFAQEMPPDWWDIPTDISNSRTREAPAQFERIMCQIWHFELATLLHLPFMLRASNNHDRRYEYSHILCLNAARELIKRWISIRENRAPLLFSNLLEFQAFTAATTLLLALLGPEISTTHQQERYEDSQLVERVVQNFELTRHDAIGMSVSAQSILVIRTLQQFLQEGNPSERLRVEIPFFGVIRVARSGAVQPILGERLLGANSVRHQDGVSVLQPSSSSSTVTPSVTINGRSSPTLMPRPSRKRAHQEIDENGEESCIDSRPRRGETLLHVSNNHFSIPDAPHIMGGVDTTEWSFEESDMVFFDSLVNTDLVGNWTL